MNLSRSVGWGFGSYVVMKKKFKKYRRNRMCEPVGFMSFDGTIILLAIVIAAEFETTRVTSLVWRTE